MPWGYNPKNYDQAFTSLKDIKAFRALIAGPARRVSKNHVSYVRPRNGLLFDLGIYTGMDINDLLALRVGDVKDGFVYIKCASNCRVQRVFSDNLRSEIDDYIKTTHAQDDFWLFPQLSANGFGGHLEPLYVYRMLRDNGKKCGVINLGNNTLRKTFGRMWYEQGNDLGVLRSFFNQKGVCDTLDYIGINPNILSLTDPDYIVGVLKHVGVDLPCGIGDIDHICRLNEPFGADEITEALNGFDPLS